ncbi:formate dehydrogenase subunit alpha [Natronomonas sp. F2-12]|jgi:formate dehydrogenase major subunit|uniref:Formate dehydrogenase subunit alpha n=1 Tax=Natronomonas aquatica TaxID=2841590 RepID=A0A9R1CS99_9EURY|nr:formate dehydrogenase subunit alpha [Natronomonas aquatica]MCQ4332769.1 formate dehydrogenase subunit alpha [Natronomonas aquatica]
MSTDDVGGGPNPRVPEIQDPRPSTPLTETFRTGTANDPPRPERAVDPEDGPATLTVDGETVVVPPGGTLLDAVEAAGSEVPALCHYDRDTEAAEEIGPRTTCRTCMVETDEEGPVAACSTPATDGAVVDTEAAAAAEARRHNLELVLSDHNLRCTTCGKNGRCELQDTSIEEGISHPRYGVFDDRDGYEPLDPTGAIDIDRNKCILCNRCVEACNDVQVEGVLRIEGTGEETRIGFQSDAETMADSTCVSCGHCATVCPTGSLVEGGLVDATTMPLPGFTQRNSVGSVLESERDRERDEREATEELSGVARFMSKARRTAGSATDRALRTGEHLAEDVAAGVFSEGILFGIAKRVGDARLDRLDRTETTCGYCAVGCRFELYSDDERVLGVRATDPDAAPANDFSTCVKGKFGYGFIERDDRLKTPLIREGDGFREASWDEALDVVAAELEGIRRDHGADAISCFASSKCTNEEDYLMEKFARTVLGTKNIDNCARLCHSSTVAALLETVGYGAMSNSIEDVANADCYLFSGTNTTESHPVLATKVKRNVRDGADLVVVDPRKVGIAEHADQYLRSKPGYDTAWMNGMARHIIERDLHDAAFVEEHVRDFDALKRKVEPFTSAEVERLTDIPAGELTAAAERIATADSVVFGWAMGLTQHSHGTNNVRAMANLALLTGNVGKPDAGLSPFRGHNNVQGGGGDMGTLPNVLPGYQDVTDPEVLDTFEEAWGVRPPEEIGLTVPETFEAIHDGDVRGLYVMGENPALSEPDIGHANKALEETDFLVVQDLFMTETAEHADVVLPAAAFAEKSGTFTNTERRVQRVGKALDPPGEARQDWEILQSLANRIDHDGRRWDYETPTEIFEELTDVTPIYAGMSHERIETEGGLQWPCPDADHPGTRFLYEDGFNFSDGMARFVPADMGEPGELPTETYPLTLTTGRVLYHFHTGTLTRRVEAITDHVPESFVEIHPETAGTLGIEGGDTVRVESERGHIDVRAKVTERPGKGVVFVPMHFADGAVNTLTGERYDPTSGIPEYKVASVRIERINRD